MIHFSNKRIRLTTMRQINSNFGTFRVEKWAKTKKHQELFPLFSSTTIPKLQGVFGCIGLTLLYFKIAVMPLVSKTKMADARKQSVSRTHWSVLKTTSPTSISSRIFGVYSMTRIFNKFAHLPTLSLFFTFPLTGPTHSLQCDFQREHYHSLISTNSNIPLKNVYTSQPFSYLLRLFGEIFSSFKNNRNFIKPPKERNKQTTWEKTRSS